MIYLDNAAATPVDEKVIRAMTPYFSETFFNPSSAYLPAKKVRSEYEDAKNRLAHTIGAKAADIVITSGATESINLAFTVLKKYSSFLNSQPPRTTTPTFLTTPSFATPPSPQCLILETEHDSVKNAAKNATNFDSTTHSSLAEIKVDRHGTIDLADLQNKISDRTLLISVALADSELGTIQPMAKISSIIKDILKTRQKNGNYLPLFLHSDASQAFSLLDINIARMGIDLLTINSGKIYGPKGVGALYVGRGIKISPLVHGGGQERGLRSGTENVPGLIGFAKAAEITKQKINDSRKKYLNFRKIFLEKLNDSNIEFSVLGSPKNQLANFLPITFPGVDAERLIFLLEDKEVYVSTGSACAASKGVKSKTLSAIGLSDSEISGSLRISFGRMNTIKDVATAAEIIKQAVLGEITRTRQSSTTSIITSAPPQTSTAPIQSPASTHQHTSTAPKEVSC